MTRIFSLIVLLVLLLVTIITTLYNLPVLFIIGFSEILMKGSDYLHFKLLKHFYKRLNPRQLYWMEMSSQW